MGQTKNLGLRAGRLSGPRKTANYRTNARPLSPSNYRNSDTVQDDGNGTITTTTTTTAAGLSVGTTWARVWKPFRWSRPLTTLCTETAKEFNTNSENKTQSKPAFIQSRPPPLHPLNHTLLSELCRKCFIDYSTDTGVFAVRAVREQRTLHTLLLLLDEPNWRCRILCLWTHC